jgi:hydroxymethylbilane synthase
MVSRRRTLRLCGTRDDTSATRVRRVFDLLVDAHPRHGFVDCRAEYAGGGPSRSAKEPPKSVSALMQALVKREIDIAVVDAREVPLKPSAESVCAAVPARVNPFDVLISDEGVILDDQPDQARLAGVTDVQRGQLLFYRPDLTLIEEHGGFESLYRKVQRDEINGFVYAAADVEMLNRQDKVVEVFTSSICMPVAGQGAVQLHTRADDRDAVAVLRALNDPPSASEVQLERMFVGAVSKDGKGPICALGRFEGSAFRLEAAIVSPDGAEKVSGAIEGRGGDESKAVKKLAEELLRTGGKEILHSYRKANR